MIVKLKHIKFVIKLFANGKVVEKQCVLLIAKLNKAAIRIVHRWESIIAMDNLKQSANRNSINNNKEWAKSFVVFFVVSFC